jgi:hypothetical protein
MKLWIGLVLLLGLLTEASMANLGFYPTKLTRKPRFENARPGTAKLLYYGGPVLASPRVITVFWGASVNAQLQRDLGSFYSATVNSNHMDWLDQYATFGKAVDGRQGTNQHIARGSYGGEYVITPVHTKKTIDDVDILAEIELQVANNVLPKADNNTLYMIHFPAGVTITVEGAKSCQGFCAYHNGHVSKSMGNVFFGVMPDLSSGACSFGCGFGDAFDSTTAISSHELVEAVTDPFPTPGNKPAYPQAWNSSGGEEIADLCSYGNATLHAASGKNYKISQEWDNKSASCKGGIFSEGSR